MPDPTYDQSSSTVNTTNSNAASVNHTCASGANLLLARVGWLNQQANPRTVSGLTYNSVSLAAVPSSSITQTGDGAAWGIQSWYLENPTADGAAHALALTMSGNTLVKHLGASSYFDYDSLGAAATSSAAAATGSASVTVPDSASGDLVAGAMLAYSDGLAQQAPSETEEWETWENAVEGSALNASRTTAAGANTALNWTKQNQTIAGAIMTAVPIKGAAGGGAATLDASITLGALAGSADADLAIAASSTVTLGAATLGSAASAAITADLSQALGGLTLSGETDLAIAAALDQSLGALTLSVDSDLAIAADLSATLGDLTLTAEADLAIAADLDQSLGTLTLSSDASSDQGIDAALDVTLGDLTLASGATLALVATADVTLGALTLASDASAAIGADLAQTLGTLTLSADANSGAEITADLDVTLGALSLSADATVPQPDTQTTGSAGQPSLRTRRRRRSIRHIAPALPPLPRQIRADASLRLGALQLVAAASLGEHPAKARRRKAVAALLLH